ncbi:MAG: hypothetical protein COV36_01080 [Alphaproteobacteria bacterium CG11_big_fil_rev_8_21_14_0_20_44_7]|nr:MAG: hypothetical protein COV36_01080 [Alphaproteobacteria bacterium CG11_big_fil_rev_8_21_14_0_20_44_7]
MIFKKSSLRQRLISIILAISGICVILTTVAITLFGIYNIREKMVVDLNVTGTLTADRIATFVKFGQNKQKIEESLEIFSSGEERLKSIKLACVYTKDIFDEFELLAAKKRDDQVARSCPGEDEIINNAGETFFGGDNLHSFQEINFKGENVGYMYIESDLQEINSYIKAQFITAFVVIIAIVLISYFLAQALQKSISQPILHLVDVARSVAKYRDYNIRADNFLKGEDINKNEISVLIDAFNKMLSEVEERRMLLLRKNTELVKAKDAAEAANKAKSQFLANISHELRTPLNAIIGFSDILHNQMLGPIGNDKYAEYAKDINESGTFLLDQIRDLLDYSRAEAGKLDLNLQEINCEKNVRECIKYISKRAEDGNLNIITEIQDDMPAIVADRIRFKQIITNLLSNAVKFTDTGGEIRIIATAKAIDSDSTEFKIIIKDTGIGMTKDDINVAFKVFAQVDGGLDRKYEGTGLGLPLTKKLVELHGGSLELDSTPGEGTSAILTFISKPQEDEDNQII